MVRQKRGEAGALGRGADALSPRHTYRLGLPTFSLTATNKLRNVVGRVTPCAPFSERAVDCGAHGVTRPTDPNRMFPNF